MARPLRVGFPGACHHVMSRPNFRFPIFEEEQDREFFLGKLIEFAGRFGVKIRAYGIMVNHWHGGEEEVRPTIWKQGERNARPSSAVSATS